MSNPNANGNSAVTNTISSSTPAGSDRNTGLIGATTTPNGVSVSSAAVKVTPPAATSTGNTVGATVSTRSSQDNAQSRNAAAKVVHTSTPNAKGNGNGTSNGGATTTAQGSTAAITTGARPPHQPLPYFTKHGGLAGMYSDWAASIGCDVNAPDFYNPFLDESQLDSTPASATDATNAPQSNANASSTGAESVHTAAPTAKGNDDVATTTTAATACTDHCTLVSGTSTAPHSANAHTSQGNAAASLVGANANFSATPPMPNPTCSPLRLVATVATAATSTPISTDTTPRMVISHYQPEVPCAQPSVGCTAQSAVATVVNNTTPQGCDCNSAATASTGSASAMTPVTPQNSGYEFEAPRSEPDPTATAHSNADDRANWVSAPYPQTPVAAADADSADAAVAAAAGASLVRNSVIDSMHEHFQGSTQVAVTQQDSATTSGDNSGLIKPSLAELNEILQHIDGTDRSNQIKVCWVLGNTYNHAPQVRSLLESWLKSQLGLDTPVATPLVQKQYTESMICFDRKSDSPHKLDAVLRLAQDGGYQLPAKFKSWLQPNPNDSADGPQQAKLSAELGLKDFERALKTKQADLSSKVLSYWLVSSEDESSRFSFLSNNAKRFDYFAPLHQPIIQALFEYCKGLRKEDQETGAVSHQPFSYPSFVRWACEHYPQDITKKSLDALAQYKDSLSRRVDVFENMQLLYETSWRLQAITAAKTFIIKVCEDADYSKCRKARNDFLIKTNGVDPDQTLGISGMAANATKVTTALTEKDERWKYFVPTGYPLIDDAIQGYQRGGVTIFAASSGLGKTWFGIDSSFKLLEKFNGRALFFSSEMDVDSINLRYFGIATNSKIGINDLELAKKRDLLPLMLKSFAGFTQRHYTYEDPHTNQPNLYTQNNLNEQLRIYGNEVNGLALSKIVESIDEERTKAPIDLVVVDYLQNINNDLIDPKAPRHTQLTNIVDVLKGVGKRNDCAILLLAQLNNPATWPAKRNEPPVPTANNIAEASFAIQPAAAVLMMYKVANTSSSVMDFPFQLNEGESFNFDPTDEEVFDENNRPLRTPLRLVITKSRFNSSKLQLDEPIFVERSRGSRFNFYL